MKPINPAKIKLSALLDAFRSGAPFYTEPKGVTRSHLREFNRAWRALLQLESENPRAAAEMFAMIGVNVEGKYLTRVQLDDWELVRLESAMNEQDNPTTKKPALLPRQTELEIMAAYDKKEKRRKALAAAKLAREVKRRAKAKAEAAVRSAAAAERARRTKLRDDYYASKK